MANVDTFNLTVFFNGHFYFREHHNISRTAVKYYVDYYKQNPDYTAHAVSIR